MRLAAILLMLLLAGIVRAGEDDDDDTDPDLPALSQHLRSIDENLQREADHPEAIGEEGDPGDKPAADAPGGMGAVEPGDQNAGEPSLNADGSEVTTPAPAPVPTPPVGARNAAVLKPATAAKPAPAAKPEAAQQPSPAAGPRPGLESPIGTSPLQNPRPDPLASPSPPPDDDS
jgi:hypothetical protein